MKGDDKIISALNGCLANELIAINQYFLHARMFRNWGFGELNEREYKKSIQDMKHADKLIERILFLEGIPNLQKLGKLYIGENSEEMLNCDMKLQMQVLKTLRESITLCEELADFVSRDILCGLLDEEEEHVDWIETQMDLISRISIENYLQSKMDDD